MEKELVLRKVKNTFILERIDLTYKLDNMEEVLQSFLETGDCLYFSCLLEDAEQYGFIGERVVFRNKQWVEPLWRSVIIPKLAWYKIIGAAEAKLAIENDLFFTYIILKEGRTFGEYSCVISYIEDDIGCSLVIYPKDKRMFLDKILSKVAEFLPGFRVIYG